MRKSAKISLLFLSLLPLSGCTDDVQHDFYKTKEDCVKEWNSEEKCEEGTHHAYGHGYYGPHYFYSGSNGVFYHEDGTPATRTGSGRALSTSPASSFHSSSSSSSTTRGGFGGTGHAFGGASA